MLARSGEASISDVRFYTIHEDRTRVYELHRHRGNGIIARRPLTLFSTSSL